MWEMQTQFDLKVSGFSLRIDQPSDSPLETSLKSIIKDMIQFNPLDRLPIGEVVERLSNYGNPHQRKIYHQKQQNV